MKIPYYPLKVLLMTILLASVQGTLHAQRIVEVAPGFNTLNDAIGADPNPDEAIFLLERNGVYEMETEIAYQGEILRLHAAEGDGARPILQLVVDITGSNAANFFGIRSNLELEGIVMLGIDDMGVDVNRHVRMRGDSTRLVINNGLLDTSEQSFLRVDAPWVSIFVTNSTIRNGGIQDDQGGGRFIDTRGNDMDTILVQNSTLYNTLNTLLRSDGGFIHDYIFEHNTVANHGFSIALGRTVRTRIRNNVFHNLYPRNASTSLRSFITVDTLISAYGFEQKDRIFNIRDNNFVTEERVIQALPDSTMRNQFFHNRLSQYVVDPHIMHLIPDTTEVTPEERAEILRAERLRYMEEEMNIFAEELSFEKPPIDMIEYVNYLWAGGLTDFPNWRAYEDERAYDDPYGFTGDLPEDRFNFTYPTSARSYTAADKGFPLGDLNWYPAAYEEWIATDVQDFMAERPGTFRLMGNYPNPFNPSTTIVFDLPHQAEVTINVYDILGRQVMSMPSMQMSAGSGQQVQLDAATLASGIYFYQVLAVSAQGPQAQTGRMVLLK